MLQSWASAGTAALTWHYEAILRGSQGLQLPLAVSVLSHEDEEIVGDGENTGLPAYRARDLAIEEVLKGLK